MSSNGGDSQQQVHHAHRHSHHHAQSELRTDVRVSESIGDIQALTSLVTDTKCGAIASFLGTTRDTFCVDGVEKTVVRLEYEAYTEMAVKQIHDLVAKCRATWTEVFHVVVHHRTGIVPPGEASVAIAVSSPHRKDALHAVEYLIDEVKRVAPIWKKEVYADETSNWKQNCC